MSVEANALAPLVQAAASGDRQAAADLLRALLPRVRNLVRYLVRGDRDVDDLAQEALVAILRGLRSYRGDGPVSAWVDRIVVRSTFAGLRKRRDLLHGPTLELVPAPEAGAAPDEYFRRRRAVQLLDELPAPQREAVALHYAAGWSVPEIAAATGAPLETVRSRLRLGMARLRELWPSARLAKGGDHVA